MITDIKTLYKTFQDKHVNTISIRSAYVPVRFFNKQPKLKDAPVYPMIVIQPFAPVPEGTVFTEPTKEFVSVVVDEVSVPGVKYVAPPEREKMMFQVSLVTDRFDDVTALFQAALGVFKDKNGDRWLQVGNDRVSITILTTTDIPTISEGTFEWIITYETTFSLFNAIATTPKPLVTDMVIDEPATITATPDPTLNEVGAAIPDSNLITVRLKE